MANAYSHPLRQTGGQIWPHVDEDVMITILCLSVCNFNGAESAEAYFTPLDHLLALFVLNVLADSSTYYKFEWERLGAMKNYRGSHGQMLDQLIIIVRLESENMLWMAGH